MAALRVRVQTPKGSIIPKGVLLTDTLGKFGEILMTEFSLPSINGYRLIKRDTKEKFIIGGEHNEMVVGLIFSNGDSLLLEVPEEGKAHFHYESTPAVDDRKAAFNTRGSSQNINTLGSLSTKEKMDETSIPIDPMRDLRRHQVAANNSCLFLCVRYGLNGVYEEDHCPELREIIANHILANKVRYEGLLEMSPDNYATWIRDEKNWGGAVELQIFSEFYKISFKVLDCKTGSFVPIGTESYENCIYLRFDGNHYDILVATCTGGRIQTSFKTSDKLVLKAALQYGKKAAVSSKNVQLKCKICSFICLSQDEVVKHTTKTGHTNYEELD